LSALFDILLSCLGYIFWYFVPYPSGTPSFLSIFCEVYAWRFIEQCLPIWGIFLLGWLLSFLIGYRSIEISKGAQISRKNRISNFFRSISDFERIRWLLCIYALLVLS